VQTSGPFAFCSLISVAGETGALFCADAQWAERGAGPQCGHGQAAVGDCSWVLDSWGSEGDHRGGAVDAEAHRWSRSAEYYSGPQTVLAGVLGDLVLGVGVRRFTLHRWSR
jgi:hypothetical protein